MKNISQLFPGKSYMKSSFRFGISKIFFLLILLVLSGSCKKQDDKLTDDPFKVIAITPLTDNIPYQVLGSGKIVFDRINDTDGSGIYVIDADNKKTSGFRLNSLIMEPNVSPDGTRIACTLLNSADWQSSWNIYLMNIDGSDCYPAFQSNEWESFPTWTPDGSKLIYYLSTENEGPLYMQSPVENASDRISLTKFYYGDDPEWIINPSGGFSISPAGKLVCVASSVKLFGILGIDPYTGKSGVSTLLSMTASQKFESPVYSPDGLKIAFLSIESDLSGSWKTVTVEKINTDGTNRIQLVSVNAYKTPAPYTSLYRYVSLCWSPDGSKILFTVPTEESGCHLFVVNADGTALTQVTDNIRAYDSEVSWSR